MTEKPKPEGYEFGRPTDYTPELGKKICNLVAIHPWGLKKLCATYDWLPDQLTIHRWRWSIPDFCNQYTKAKIAQSELMVEDCIDIADETSEDITFNKHGDEVCNTEFVNRSRLRVDTRKWLASKLLPKIYGDFKRAEDAEQMNEELKKELRTLRAELDEKNKKEF